MAYRALISLLADADPAMQLAAVASLQALIDDWSASPRLHLWHCLDVTDPVHFSMPAVITKGCHSLTAILTLSRGTQLMCSTHQFPTCS